MSSPEDEKRSSKDGGTTGTFMIGKFYSPKGVGEKS